MRRLLLAAACGLMMTGYAYADAVECKGDWQRIVSSLEDRGGFKIVEMNASQRATAIVNFNAAPPVTTFAPDHIYTVEHDGDMMIVLVAGTACVPVAQPVDAEGLSKLLTDDHGT